MDIGHLQIAADHFLIVLKTTAGKDNAAVCLDAHIGSFFIDDNADNRAVSICDQLFTRGSKPHIDITGFDSLLAQIVVAAVKTGTGSGQAQAVFAGRNLRKLCPVIIPVILSSDLVGILQAAIAAICQLPVGIGCLKTGCRMLGRGNDRRIAAHRTCHPVIIFRAALTICTNCFRIPVLEFAHKGRQIVIQPLGIICCHDELSGNRGIAAFCPFRRFFGQKNTGALLIRSDGRIGTGTAVSQDNNIIFRVPLQFIRRFLRAGLHAGKCCQGQCSETGRCSFEKISS